VKPLLATLALTTIALAQSGERLQPDHLPTPYTAEQIRKACGEGRQTTWVIKMDGKVQKTTFAFGAGDKKGCTFTISEFKEDGTPKGKPRSMQLTWKQLQAHASYPEKGTKITTETIQLKAGKFECWVYAREAAGQVSRFYFAKKLPGPPVKLVVDREGKTVYSMVMVAHKAGKKVDQKGK